MTLVDTNLLVYATFRGAPEHTRVRKWLNDRLAAEPEPVVLCWPVLYSFMRLITSSRVMGPHAVGVGEGWETVAAYVEAPGTRLVVAGSGHAAIAAELARTPGLRSDDVPDIELAALAIEQGLVLATHDHGFRRFDKLRLFDPLA